MSTVQLWFPWEVCLQDTYEPQRHELPEWDTGHKYSLWPSPEFHFQLTWSQPHPLPLLGLVRISHQLESYLGRRNLHGEYAFIRSAFSWLMINLVETSHRWVVPPTCRGSGKCKKKQAEQARKQCISMVSVPAWSSCLDISLILHSKLNDEINPSLHTLLLSWSLSEQ